ncbi:MAG: hypothetical protein WAQ53_10500 [Thiofilum sp.]|uniref:hypothetical protein n=1 Tax=Thiofilum sp. TaxID=2212733 RepID=UPI0025E28719|nr:hypothetical protein [Thiofilum sp.]MBK8453292.1 hypothetical protein [Thiofilum sp.]
MMQSAQQPTTYVHESSYKMTQRLIEGLMLYRNELGELGQRLELLIRCERVLRSDQAFLERVH